MTQSVHYVLFTKEETEADSSHNLPKDGQLTDPGCKPCGSGPVTLATIL